MEAIEHITDTGWQRNTHNSPLLRKGERESGILVLNSSVAQGGDSVHEWWRSQYNNSPNAEVKPCAFATTHQFLESTRRRHGVAIKHQTISLSSIQKGALESDGWERSSKCFDFFTERA